MDDKTAQTELCKFDGIQNYLCRVNNLLYFLTSSDFQFNSCFELSDGGLDSLSQIARHLPKLKQLKIECYS